ncbi:MAG: succinate dehydrogenase/fumarate reductase iron-sulfur subunit [Desulfurococcales archaeon]|nr:succinate dehydrogenase/fumarate reductase iron-sulfur subunit [Desulfurococcales archaeon]
MAQALKSAARYPPKSVRVKIKRYSPETGREWWQVYEVEAYRGMTVLDALLQVKEKRDHTIVMRYSCRMGVCGSCGMVINGTPRLACQTQVSMVASEENPEFTVEPMKNFPVIRDLLTDFTSFFEKHRKVKPYLIRRDTGEQENPKTEYRMTPEELLEIYPYSLCISCGLCVSACPVSASDEGFLGPQALAQLWRYTADVRDEAWRERLEIADDENGALKCHFAASCSAVCPKAVDPGGAIQMLRSALLKYKLGLWRKKSISGPVPPLEPTGEKMPLPPEAQTLPGVDLEAMEREPVVIDASRLLD